MTKTLLILGGGTGGTMIANRMARLLDSAAWRIIVVDRDPYHYYQPGFVFIPFGIYHTTDVIKPKALLFDPKIEIIFSEIDVIEPEKNRVRLINDQHIIYYDELVIATGTQLDFKAVPGVLSSAWQKNIFDFYSLQGAGNLSRFFQDWKGGRLVVNIASLPIKGSNAPLEFLFLADWAFRRWGLRDKVELVLTTPAKDSTEHPTFTQKINPALHQKGIYVEAGYQIAEVDYAHQIIRSHDHREIGYDVLVTVPAHKGSPLIERSNMGNDHNYLPVDPYNLRSQHWENVWGIGDATNLPTAKTGSAAHHMLPVLAENLRSHISKQPLKAHFDGHASYFVESGDEKAFMLDFNYDVEPLQGKYPLPVVGPFSLLQESTTNHRGKMSFKWFYWNVMIPGHDMPFDPSQMSLMGKHL